MRSYIAALAIAVTVFAVPSTADTTVATFRYVTEYSGAYFPAGPTPWLTATFDDGDTPGSVQLTLDTDGLTGSEFVGSYRGKGASWLFNFNPDKNLDDLVISQLSGRTADSVLKDLNGLHATGDGHLDFGFGWESGNRLGKDEVVVFSLTMDDLVVTDFDFLSVDGKGVDDGTGLLTAVHVQGIGMDGDDSGWVTVPEPSSFIVWGLLGLAFGCMAEWRRRKAG